VLSGKKEKKSKTHKKINWFITKNSKKFNFLKAKILLFLLPRGIIDIEIKSNNKKIIFKNSIIFN